jgi:hypothetical protein
MSKTLVGEKQPEAGLATVKTSTLAAREEVPEFLRDMRTTTGLEEMDRGDMILPRLAIAQSLSPALKKNNAKYIAGLEEGMLYNTVTRRIYGMSVTVVPILFSKMRIKFEDITKGGGILCTSPNAINGGRLHPSDCATCPHSQFGDNGDAPDCNNFMNYASILPNHDLEVIVVSMKSTALAVAKQWNSMLRMLRKPAFAKYYLIESVPETRNNNDFFNYRVTQKGFVNEELFRMGEQLHEQLRAQGIKVDLTDEDAGFNTSEMDDADTQGM